MLKLVFTLTLGFVNTFFILSSDLVRILPLPLVEPETLFGLKIFFTLSVSLVIMLFCLRTNQFNRDIEELKIKLEF